MILDKTLTFDLTKPQNEGLTLLRELGISNNKRKYTNFNIITFDIETWGLVPENLALAIFYDGENYKEFYLKEEVMNYIDNLEHETLIYAHNGFNFDFNIFIEDVLSRKMTFQEKGGVRFLRYKNKNDKLIVFRDSVYILPNTLDNLGKSFGDGTYKGVTPTKFINPKEINFNRIEFEKDRKAFNLKHITNEDIEYCRDDCKVLYNVLHNEEVMNLDFKNYNTIAKISNTKMFSEIEPILVNDLMDRKFKNLYSGGLTSVFKHNVENELIETYDVNSMYPYAMSSYFANSLYLIEHDYDIGEDTKEWFDMIENYANGLSVVTISLKKNTPKNIVNILRKTPLLPLYKTSYLDMFDGCKYKIEVMNSELNNIFNPKIKKYFNIEVHSSIYCPQDKLFYPFKEFITHKYNERLKNKKTREAYATILKLIMNSSYGYFAMQVDNSNYVYGNRNEIVFAIEKLLNEHNLKVQSFREFVSENMRAIETSDGYEFEGSDVEEYFSYLQEELGEFEELKFKTLNEIKVENQLSGLYVMYYSSAKNIVPDKTSFYIASEITSKSRAYLGRLALEVAFSNNEVCYCDTDSLHIQVKDKAKLDKALLPFIDNNELGKLKFEGAFEKGLWFSKKHYYLFRKIGNKFVCIKDALKGFRASTPIDRFIYKQSVVNVSKMGSRIKNVSFETNTISKDKTFLNFVVSRKRDGYFFNAHQDNVIENLQHKRELRDLYYAQLDKNNYVPKKFIKSEDLEQIKKEVKEYGLIKLTKKNLEKRINEIEEYHKENALNGVYDTLQAIKFFSKEEEKHIAREVLGIEGYYRNRKQTIKKDEKKKYVRPSRAKSKRIFKSEEETKIYNREKLNRIKERLAQRGKL